MERRDLLKALALGSLSAGTLFLGNEAQAEGISEKELNELSQFAQNQFDDFENGRSPEELQRDADLMKQRFFTDAELRTVTQLADIIIPADERSGSASQAKVPDFIEFILKDMPQFQTPMRGGLRWLDSQCLKASGKVFTECTQTQQLALIDQIAYPEQAKPEMKHGVTFFNLMRNLTATGYFSTEMGWKYIEYKGNVPNNWEGVPADVLAKYNLKYD